MGNPVDMQMTEALDTLDAAYIKTLWQKAIERCAADPEGAITAARSLAESTCKRLLDELGISYSDDTDLPKLYGLVANAIKIAPSQHTDQVFKQILGGCCSVVNGVGAMRNRLGDSHGKGKDAIIPDARYAEFAVNLAGSLALFLISTWKATCSLAASR